MTREEIAWAAGLFEGEGCISISKPKSGSKFNQNRIVQLSMTDKDVVDKFHNLIGFGLRYEFDPSKRNPTWKIRYDWKVYKAEHVQAFLAAIWCFLCERRKKKATEAIRLCRTVIDKCDQYFCKYGHEFNEKNTRRTFKDGYWHRNCRPCDARKQSQKRRLKNGDSQLQ